MRFFLPLFLALLPAASPAAEPAGAGAPPAETVFETAIKPMIRESCADCHNATRHKGGLDLTRFLKAGAADALRDRDVWETVAEKIRTREMPPEDEPQPFDAQVEIATTWIDQHYAALDSQAPLNPGRVTARRLNRTEYANTVRDLLGVSLRFSDDFPPDASGYGFDNIGDVLSLSPILTEKYLKAAEDIAQIAIPLEQPTPVNVRYTSETMGQQFRLNIRTNHDVLAEGTYNIRIGWEQGNPTGTRHISSLLIDGQEVMWQTVKFATHQVRLLRRATESHARRRRLAPRQLRHRVRRGDGRPQPARSRSLSHHPGWPRWRKNPDRPAHCVQIRHTDLQSAPDHARRRRSSNRQARQLGREVAFPERRLKSLVRLFPLRP